MAIVVLCMILCANCKASQSVQYNPINTLTVTYNDSTRPSKAIFYQCAQWPVRVGALILASSGTSCSVYDPVCEQSSKSVGAV